MLDCTSAARAARCVSDTHPRAGARLRLASTALTVLAALAIGGCGGDGGGSSDAPAPTDTRTAAERCSALAGTSIAAGSLTLPTNGVAITSATMVPASGSGSTAQVEHCKVLADIRSIDPAAQPIKMQVNLPTTWNGKAFHLGGGGYDGSVVTGEGDIPGGAGFATPLARGYATFGGDGGHEGDATTAFLNDEVLTNYLGVHLKKTRDAAVYLINARYGTQPAKTYFAGGSGGGREAFYAMQRQTQDYDGIIAFYPAWPLNEMLMNYGRLSRAMALPGAYPNVAKQALLYQSVVNACDGQDGVLDGLVSNDRACSFNVATLRCPSGGDEGDRCLSDAQIGTFNAFAGTLNLPYTVASGESGYPGYNIYKGVDPRGTIGLGTAAPLQPPATTNAPGVQPFASWIYDTYAQGWVSRNTGVNSLLLDPVAPGVYQPRISFLSSLVDMNNTDLTTFRNKGGKLLMLHGKADETIPTASSADYWTRLQARMGASTVAAFAKYYEVPGYGHGDGAFVVSWDSIAALENWVEKGMAPVAQVVADNNAATRGRTRPLCEYPAWPRYNGTGDQNLANNYACVTS